VTLASDLAHAVELAEQAAGTGAPVAAQPAS